MSLRILKDRFACHISAFLSACCVVVLILIAIGLTYKSFPILHDHSLSELLFSTIWSPMKGKFGFLSFIISTIQITTFSLLIAFPICLLSATYLVELAPRSILKIFLPLIDILAGVPSVIYGIWGVLMIVPFVRDYVAPFFGYTTSGYCILTGSLVLAIMVVPVMMHLLIQVLQAVPHELRDSTLSLGATHWQMIKLVVWRKCLPGIMATTILGISKAIGETIAVLMVVGNVVQIPKNIFESGYPIPALIANNYGEMLSIPQYDAALMLAALLLLIVILFFNMVSAYVLKRVTKSIT